MAIEKTSKAFRRSCICNACCRQTVIECKAIRPTRIKSNTTRYLARDAYSTHTESHDIPTVSTRELSGVGGTRKARHLYSGFYPCEIIVKSDLYRTPWGPHIPASTECTITLISIWREAITSAALREDKSAASEVVCRECPCIDLARSSSQEIHTPFDATLSLIVGDV